jgi:hypothetical protein
VPARRNLPLPDHFRTCPAPPCPLSPVTCHLSPVTCHLSPVPRPFIFRPPVSTATTYPPGQAFDFTLTLSVLSVRLRDLS